MNLMPGQRKAIERVIYEKYNEISTEELSVVPDRNTLEGDTAKAISAGLHAAELVAQRKFSCGVLDMFDVYFRVPRLGITKEICDTKLSKRVTVLPSRQVEAILKILFLLHGDGLLNALEEHMDRRKQHLLAKPVRAGSAGTYDIEIMVALKGTCNWCNGVRSSTTLRCSCGCAYCSKACQKQHWPWHKQMEHRTSQSCSVMAANAQVAYSINKHHWTHEVVSAAHVDCDMCCTCEVPLCKPCLWLVQEL